MRICPFWSLGGGYATNPISQMELGPEMSCTLISQHKRTRRGWQVRVPRRVERRVRLRHGARRSGRAAGAAGAAEADLGPQAAGADRPDLVPVQLLQPLALCRGRLDRLRQAGNARHSCRTSWHALDVKKKRASRVLTLQAPAPTSGVHARRTRKNPPAGGAAREVCPEARGLTRGGGASGGLTFEPAGVVGVPLLGVPFSIPAWNTRHRQSAQPTSKHPASDTA